MQTFIISSKKIENAKNYALENITGEKVDKLDIESYEPDKALGIDDVRDIQKRIHFKPLMGDRKAVLIIIPFGATIEAQNSMLKILEEPPESTLIYLVTNNHKTLLPTILSRAKVIEIKGSEIQTDGNGLHQLLSIGKTGNGLYLAQELAKDKNGAIDWLEEVILESRKKMLLSLENPEQSLKLRKLIHKLELTHYDLKTTNANPRLALENLFLNI